MALERHSQAGPGDDPTRLLRDRYGNPLDLSGMFAGAGCFLIGGGPSLAGLNLSALSHPGCLSMGMNNSPKTWRPDLWVSVDDPSCFLRSIWRDPKIMKFVPGSHAAKPVFDSDAWKFLYLKAGDCPNVFYFERNANFNTTTYLTEQTVNWGSHRRNGGGRSVMLAAMRLLYYLGVRKVFLLGVDFRMDSNYTYHFEQARHRAVIDCNRRTYSLLNDRFSELVPVFADAGFEVFNCNPDSGLRAFPFLQFEEAVRQCRDGFPEDLKLERTEGLYDQSKNRVNAPPIRERRLKEAHPPMSRPEVFPAPPCVGQQEHAKGNRSDLKEGVAVGCDQACEWLLEWWYGNYARHNDHQVTFVSFGMSDRAVAWCRERGPVYALPRRAPRLSEAWFYKPYLFTLCRAEKVLAIDLDCEIRGSIRPVFDLIGDTPVAAKDRVVFQEYRHLFARDCHFNSGVVGAPRDHPLILEWGRLCLERHLEFRSDQDILNLALYSGGAKRITELPAKYNHLRVKGDSTDAVIMHWTGEVGKAHIREMMGLPGSSEDGHDPNPCRTRRRRRVDTG